MECAAKDLHSGVFGGTVNEGMVDLIWMMNQLVDEDGNILVEGLMDMAGERRNSCFMGQVDICNLSL